MRGARQPRTRNASSTTLLGVPVDPADRTDVEQGRALMAAAMLYHSRELRPPWWQLFELIKSEPDELERVDAALAETFEEVFGEIRPSAAA